MRLLAITIVILAGAVMAGAGVIANAMPAARYNDLDGWGLAVVGLGAFLFIVEWWPVARGRLMEGVRAREAA